MNRIALVVISVLSLFAETARAGKLLDWIREYDLNDYALGVSVATSQNPFAGAKNGTIAYPYLTSFRHEAFTDDWIMFRDGGMGFRWVSDNGWEIGAQGRIQTLGLGNSESDELRGVEDRLWTIEIGPTISYRAWPVHINWTTYFEPTDRHDGLFNRLRLSYPIEWDRGWFVPSVAAVHRSVDYNDYYFAVRPPEATPSRPEYGPDSSVNPEFRIEWGYALSDLWLLSGSVGYQLLDDTVTGSPIVGRDSILTANVGVAYNANIFQPRDYEGTAPSSRRVDLRVAAFRNNIDSKVVRNTSDGIPGFEIDVEDFLGAPDQETVLQVDATVRIGYFHRLDFGYFEFGRNSTTTLENDIDIGDQFFPAGTELGGRFDTRVFRAGYTYSLMRDSQKELGVMAGLHFVDFKSEFFVSGQAQQVRSRAGTPLPVIGASGSVFLGARTLLSAKLQFFRMDFDRYEGNLNYATLDIQRQLNDMFSIGLGYNYYGMRLSSDHSDLNGYLQVRHHGPIAFFNLGF